MNGLGDRKVLVHCWLNVRASAYVYAHRVTQHPDTQDAEFERLETVWSEVAEVELAMQPNWMTFLEENVGVQD